jgi:phosphonate transport system permease protein
MDPHPPPAAVDALVRDYRRSFGSLAWRGGVVLVVILASMAYGGLFDAGRLGKGIPSIVSLGGEMLPPDFRHARDWGKPLLATLVMSVAGTALSIALALPLGCLAARNVSPHPVLYRLARWTLNGLRSLPELILGILFVAAVGFGVLPGILALGLHSAGMVGKFFAEAIEHADPAPIEAVRACGASRLQVILHGIFPQVFPQMADVSIYRWEFNFRASTVMGMIGAGGIGFELIGSLRLMLYQEVCAILIVILVMVCLMDALSSALRRRLQ